MTEVVLFWIFGACTTLFAIGVVIARSPIHSAMSLVATFFFLAALYVLLWAHTLAVIQVLVYAGAIMVLFLFVIMLLSLAEPAGPRRVTFGRVVGGALSAGLLFLVATAILSTSFRAVSLSPARSTTFGSLRRLGELLYTAYLFPFEAVSLLLLVAIVGSVVIAKPRI